MHSLESRMMHGNKGGHGYLLGAYLNVKMAICDVTVYMVSCHGVHRDSTDSAQILSGPDQ
jgi:hypothetical protein